MTDIEIGQVLSLRIRFNNSGSVSTRKHPYLVVKKNVEFCTIEIAQIDSLAGKEFKAARRCNKVVFADNPHETVIDKDSYIQLDNTFLLEEYIGLDKYRRQKDKLSPTKLTDVIEAYDNYHSKYQILEDKQVYMSKEEIEALQ